MTIRTHISARALNDDWSHFEDCADQAPEGTYDQAKAIATLISDLAGETIKQLRELGLKANNCDGIREVEAVLYGYIRDSNPEATIFPTAEGFEQR